MYDQIPNKNILNFTGMQQSSNMELKEQSIKVGADGYVRNGQCFSSPFELYLLLAFVTTLFLF